MRRMTVLFISALFLAALLAGCGKPAAPVATPEPAASASATTPSADPSPEPAAPLEGMELRYRDVAIGDTVERMYSLLGEPEECTEHRYTDPDPPQGLEYREYNYNGAVFREAYTEAEGWTGVIGQIEILDTGDTPGPRGICIGDAPEDVMAHFPKEYDYGSDTYSRFYGLPPYDGAGGCAYPGPGGEVLTVILTTDEVEPYLRIEFLEGKAVRLFMGYSWI